MPRKPVSATLAQYGAPQAQQLAPSARREASIRRIMDKYGDPLDILARAARDGDTKAAATLLPYCYPQLRAVELTGAEGGALQVQVVKLSGVLPQDNWVKGAKPETQSTQVLDVTGKP